MIAIALRTLFIYVFLTFIMRISGKRQVGQLQIGELVTALLLSELAAFPIADQSIPLIFAILPVTLILLLEILSACLCALFPRIKKIIEGTPSLLIVHGKLHEKALYTSRLSPDELLAQLRLKNISDLSLVDYAILEQNGQLSVILKPEKQPVTPEDLNLTPQTVGMAKALIVCGKIDRSNLKHLNITEKTLKKQLGNTRISDVLLYTVNDGGERRLILKEDQNK